MASTFTARDEIRNLLQEIGVSGTFAARRTAAAEALDLEVRGVGPLRFPISRAQAEQLCQVARPARYGRGEQTLLDRRVRDTWEVPKSRVKIDQRRWNRTLLPVLERLRADLGLPDGCRLKAELHSLLVYGPGQFFLPHQDSEKSDEMVGTLVVTLPSSFKGGDFVVELQGERVVYRGSKARLSFVAFYADCQHEVRPVREGYRIVLTYNLLLHGASATAASGTEAVSPAMVEALARCLREHFETLLPPRWEWKKDAPPREPPNRLIYLLDHQYTERGLSWHLLKGQDAARAAALQAAAERCGCELVLALADVNEIWNCLESDWGPSRYGRQRRWQRDEDDEWYDEDPYVDDPDTYELDGLIDHSITLSHWIDPAGKAATPIATDVADEEVCATTPSSALEAYASEFEGYMGNYGNTMDRWYHRAAIVLWPRERSFVVRAEASPAWAMDELKRRLRKGDRDAAREMVASLLPFWSVAAVREQRRGFCGSALHVAEGLDDAALAATLLRPFGLEGLTSKQASAWVALTKRYGQDWVKALLTSWTEASRHRWSQDPLASFTSLPRLCNALRTVDETMGPLSARLILEDRWSWASNALQEALRLAGPSQRAEALAAFSGPILSLLESAAAVAAVGLRDEMLASLCTEENGPLVPCLVQVLRAAARSVPLEAQAELGLDTLRQHCVRQLGARLEKPPRQEDDWSITPPQGCRCELCATLGDFLADPTQQSLAWPIAQEKRRHVHHILDSHELPVRHETKRSGRPYTLMLTKTRDLFKREAQARRSWQSDLEWLTQRAQTR